MKQPQLHEIKGEDNSKMFPGQILTTAKTTMNHHTLHLMIFQYNKWLLVKADSQIMTAHYFSHKIAQRDIFRRDYITIFH